MRGASSVHRTHCSKPLPGGPGWNKLRTLATEKYGASVVWCFRGEHEIFSNMYDLEDNHGFSVCMDGMWFRTTEAAYMAAKTLDITLRRKIQALKDGKQAKSFARKMEWRKDWNEVKYQVMEDVVRQKFQHPELRQKLLATGDCHIMEGNTWNDGTWGVVVRDGELYGKNYLGQIIMKVRSELSPSLHVVAPSSRTSSTDARDECAVQDAWDECAAQDTQDECAVQDARDECAVPDSWDD